MALRVRRPLTLLVATVWVWIGCSSPEGGDARSVPKECVVAEGIKEGTPLARAGVREGDAIVAWERQAGPSQTGARGRIVSVLDWMEIEAEQAPRGPIALKVWRKGRYLNLVAPLGLRDTAGVRPWMPDSVLNPYREGMKQVDAGNVPAGVVLWQEAVRRTGTATWIVRFWLRLRIGEALLKAHRAKDAEEVARQALEEATTQSDQVARIAALNLMAEATENRPDEKKSMEALLEVKRLREKLHGRGPGFAKTLRALGRLSYLFGRLDQAEYYNQESFAIYSESAPDSLDLASVLINQGAVANERGDLAKAESFYRRALSRVQKLSPGSDLELALLSNLGVIAMAQGRLDAAEEAFLRAYKMALRLDPKGGLSAAILVGNLCSVATERGDLERAEELCREALAQRKIHAPGSLEESNSLFVLGNIAQERRRYEEAKNYYEEALTIRRKVNPQGLPAAAVLYSLGVLAMDLRKDNKAEDYHRRALAIRHGQAPGSLAEADSMTSLATVRRLRGDFKEAWALQRQALALYQQLGPGSLYEATSLLELGLIRWQQGDQIEALRHLRAAVEAIEVQANQAGGGESGKASLRGRSRDIYYRLAQLLLEMKRPAEAFGIVERFRGKVFLDLLAQRDVSLIADLPADLRQAERQLAVQYDVTLGRLAELSANTSQVAGLHSQLHILQAQRDQLMAEVRRRSPRIAGLKYQQSVTLTLEKVRAALEPGTVMLSWAVGADKTFLFVVASDRPMAIHEIPRGADQLRAEVERFNRLLLAFTNRHGNRPRTAFREAARKLYRELIGPAEITLTGQQRILLVPDDSLYLLPFGALVRDLPEPGTDGRTWQYLVEWKPLHSVLSGTVYAGLRRLRKARAQGRPPLVAFGDPATHDLPRLPGSAEEVRRIAALYPGAKIYLGAGATESLAKVAGRGSPVLHFACHGLLDESLPLNSSLALTPPVTPRAGEDNGLLQAWEIFEQMRLDADLVVLSACETASGRPITGEGLIGLTRAFQYAGARSVVASLWKVNDRSTAELMVRFHGHLRQGMPTDEALRAAQIELIRNGAAATLGDTSAPFHWAAFHLIGTRL